MLEDARQVLKEARLGTEKHRQLLVGGGENTGDDMLVLGDHTTHVYPPAKTDWGKLVLGAGLLASGVGAPLGGLLVWQGLTQQARPAVTTPVLEQVSDKADMDTVTDWQLGGGADLLIHGE